MFPKTFFQLTFSALTASEQIKLNMPLKVTKLSRNTGEHNLVLCLSAPGYITYTYTPESTNDGDENNA